LDEKELAAVEVPEPLPATGPDPAWTLVFRGQTPAAHAVFRVTKPNPIRGLQHGFGGLGEPGWQARNPLKRLG